MFHPPLPLLPSRPSFPPRNPTLLSCFPISTIVLESAASVIQILTATPSGLPLPPSPLPVLQLILNFSSSSSFYNTSPRPSDSIACACSTAANDDAHGHLIHGSSQSILWTQPRFPHTSNGQAIQTLTEAPSRPQWRSSNLGSKQRRMTYRK